MFGSGDFLLRKTLTQNNGNCLKCILRQFFSIFFGGGGVGVGVHFTITDRLKLLSSLLRPSGNCSPTGTKKNLFHDLKIIFS